MSFVPSVETIDISADTRHKGVAVIKLKRHAEGVALVKSGAD